MNALARQRDTVTAALLAAGLAVICVLLSDVSLTLQIASTLAVAGLIALAMVPNQRLVLVVLWILLHPLSVEKLFPLGAPLYPGFPVPAVVVSASDLALALLAGRLAVEAILTRRKPCAWPAAATPYAWLCGWVVVLFFTAPSVGGGVQILHWAKMLLFLLVLPGSIRTRDELLVVLVALAVAISLQSVIVWTSWRLHRPVSFITLFSSAGMPLIGFTSGEGGRLIRTSGTFGQVNQQAGLHLFFTLPLLGLVFVKNAIWRGLAIGVIGLSLSAVLLTFSRTAWVGGLVAAATVLTAAVWFKKMTRRHWARLAIFAGFGGAVLGVFSQPILDRIFAGDEGASSSRLRMIATSAELAASHPVLGCGPGNFVADSIGGRDLNRESATWRESGQPREDGKIEGLETVNGRINGKRTIIPLQVHNKYLLVLVELGCVGLLLFAWYQWRLLRTAWACLKTPDPMLFWVAAGLLGATVASHVYFMLELAYDDKSVLMLLIANALVLCLHRIVHAESIGSGVGRCFSPAIGTAILECGLKRRTTSDTDRCPKPGMRPPQPEAFP